MENLESHRAFKVGEVVEATSDCSFNSTGHYLFIESSSPRMLNDTARLFSPVYAPPEAPLACFTFWYHMYGSTTGECFTSVLFQRDARVSLASSGVA